MQSFGGTALFQGNPDDGGVGFLDAGLWDDQTGSTYTISNTEATFTFKETASGLSLTSFKDASGVTWNNLERSLWRVTVFDTVLAKELGVTVVEPLAEKVEWVQETGDGLAASWQVNVGPDRLRVVFDSTLSGDSLFPKVTCEWVGTPTRYAVDSVSVLPLRMGYRDIGNDFAVHGAIRGMAVKNPRYRFRHVPEDTAQPLAGWLGKYKNIGVSTSGKSISMPVWGYYSESDFEGWMFWADDRADEILSGAFQSDGQNLSCEYWIPQPGWVEVGNGSNSLETATTFGLRPYVGTHKYGWWDIAEHYRSRLEINQPSWYVTKTHLDSTRLPIERKPGVWVDFDVDNHAADQGAEVSGAITHLRSKLGFDSSVPIFGYVVGDPANSRPHMPGNSPVPGNTERTGVKDAHGSTEDTLENVFLGLHKPANHWPAPLENGVWGDGTTDWWTDYDGKQMYVRQRLAGILGEDETRLGNNGSLTDDFYREETNTVSSWNSSLQRIVTSSPVGDFDKFFSWGGTCVQINRNGTLLFAEVSAMPTSTILEIREPGFLDPDGNVVEPEVGDSLKIADLEDDVCHHALMNSSVKGFMETYMAKSQRDGWKQGLIYLDVYPARSLRNKSLCSGDHSGWSQINAGYTNHPKGGGNWWVKSVRDWLRTLWEAGRGQQSPGVVQMGCEYWDEVYLPYNFAGLHTTGYAKLWRTYNPGPNDPDYHDPDDHGMRPVPMFAVVHAGRGYALQRAFNFGNAALSTLSRNDDTFPTEAPKYRNVFPWWMAGEWVWGLTPPQYIHSANDSLTTDGSTQINLAGADLWNEDEYSGDNAADSAISATRDLWVDLVKAEVNWATTWLRNGQLLPPGDDQGSSLWDMQASGVFDQVFSTPISRRNDLPLVWDPHNMPRILHAPWRAVTGNSVTVFFLNWTDTSGTAHWQFDFSRYGLSGEVIPFLATASGVMTRQSSAWNSYTYNQSVAAHTMQALVLVPEQETEKGTLEIISDTVLRHRRPSQSVSHWTPVVTLEVDIRASNTPLDVSGATTKQMSAILPNGSELSVAGTLVTDGTDGRIRVDLSGSLFRSNPGVWQIRGQALISGVTHLGEYTEVVSEGA